MGNYIDKIINGNPFNQTYQQEYFIPDPLSLQYSCVGKPELLYGPGTIGQNFHYRGVALGGYFVLEPWITPSLFYQFLGPTKKWGSAEAVSHIGLSGHSFCTALGQEEANIQLRRHWNTFVTEEYIANLSYAGVEVLRVPVPDWMFLPYEPFTTCWDGSLEVLDNVISMCTKHNISITLDIHGMRGSQNGYDASGQAVDIEWSTADPNVTTFVHWPTRAANWAGNYNLSSGRYDTFNYSHVNYSLAVVRTIIEKYKNVPTVIGLEPVNEPWQDTPMEIIYSYYFESYKIMRELAPNWVMLFHDMFEISPTKWCFYF
jgi:glucan 1,3-beta-glucosidase